MTLSIEPGIKHNIIERIQKLLALSKSDNPNEAANAAALADKLINKHQISNAELQATSHEQVPVDRYKDPIYSSARRTAWKAHLASALARHYDCAVYISFGHEGRNKTSNYTLVGREEDCAIACFMFGWVSNEIERLAKKNAAGLGHNYSQTYCEGAGVGVLEKLRTEKESLRTEAQAEGKGAAIVLLDKKAMEARQKMQQLVPNLGRSAGLGGASNKNGMAFNSGREAGRNMNIGKGLGGAAKPAGLLR